MRRGACKAAPSRGVGTGEEEGDRGRRSCRQKSVVVSFCLSGRCRYLFVGEHLVGGELEASKSQLSSARLGGDQSLKLSGSSPIPVIPWLRVHSVRHPSADKVRHDAVMRQGVFG